MFLYPGPALYTPAVLYRTLPHFTSVLYGMATGGNIRGDGLLNLLLTVIRRQIWGECRTRWHYCIPSRSSVSPGPPLTGFPSAGVHLPWSGPEQVLGASPSLFWTRILPRRPVAIAPAQNDDGLHHPPPPCLLPGPPRHGQVRRARRLSRRLVHQLRPHRTILSRGDGSDPQNGVLAARGTAIPSTPATSATRRPARPARNVRTARCLPGRLSFPAGSRPAALVAPPPPPPGGPLRCPAPGP